MDYTISEKRILDFQHYLQQTERAGGTIEKYLRDLRRFAQFLSGQPVTAELAVAWKGRLIDGGYSPRTINSMLSVINAFFRYMGWNDFRVKFLRIQRQAFRDPARELTRRDYQLLLETAHSQGKARLALLMETICATGVRVSEVKYITVAAAQTGRAQISLKGKIRTILIPGKLCRKLLKFAKTQKIASGEIFITESGRSLSRRQIWAEMKKLCTDAGVERTKVFPHNLRHLFAVTFYHSCKDIAKLADVLGHSSIETTRIYLVSTGVEHCRLLDGLGLVS